MAIDSTLFAASIPAGTFTEGQTIQLGVISGPAVVRSGYGSPKLKRITALVDGGATLGYIQVENQNWDDPVISIPSSPGATGLSADSSSIQGGADAILQPNSGWTVQFVVLEGKTTSSAAAVYALIDIDYPSVASVVDPSQIQGVPASNTFNLNVTTTPFENIGAPNWAYANIDILKAGYKYAGTEYSLRIIGASPAGYAFLKISGAAGQAGLARIVPNALAPNAAVRYPQTYASTVVKGPFTVGVFAGAATATSAKIAVTLDWVKKKQGA